LAAVASIPHCVLQLTVTELHFENETHTHKSLTKKSGSKASKSRNLKFQLSPESHASRNMTHIMIMMLTSSVQVMMILLPLCSLRLSFTGEFVGQQQHIFMIYAARLICLSSEKWTHSWENVAHQQTSYAKGSYSSFSNIGKLQVSFSGLVV